MHNPLILVAAFLLACSPVPAPIGTTGPKATSTSADTSDGTTAPTSTGDATTGPEEASAGTSTGEGGACFGDQCDGPCAAGLSCEPHPDNASLAVCAAPCTREGPCAVEIDGCEPSVGVCREGFDGVLFCFSTPDPQPSACAGIAPGSCVIFGGGFCSDVLALCVNNGVQGCDMLAQTCEAGTLTPCALCGVLADQCALGPKTPPQCEAIVESCGCLAVTSGA